MSLFFDEVVVMQFARKRFLCERLLYLPERLRKFLSPIWDQRLSENLAQTLPAEACKSSTALVPPHNRLCTNYIRAL